MRWSSHQPSYPAYHIEDCWILNLLANLTLRLLASKFDRKIHPKLVNSLSYMFKEIFILLLNSILIKICTGTKLSSSIYVTESKNHSWQLSFIVSAQLKVDNGKKLGIYCVNIIRMKGGGGAFSPHFPTHFLQQIWQIVNNNKQVLEDWMERNIS